jgi:3-oxoacyl-[acyl-carrier protein] reductase
MQGRGSEVSADLDVRTYLVQDREDASSDEGVTPLPHGLSGRKALITGSGRGMGRSHAVLMAERGADIIVHDINPEGAEETASLVRAQGRKAEVIVADIRDVPRMQAEIRRAVDAIGGIHVLVNNAGISGKRRAIEDVDEAAFDEMLGVKVKGSFFATQAVLPMLKAQRQGRIINISSIYAMGGSRYSSHYSGSASALSGLTKSWARELASFQITVNAVAPGFIITDITRTSNTPEQISEPEKEMPLGRYCTPLEVSYTVAWLASEEAAMITGQVISPNAGEVIVGY